METGARRFPDMGGQRRGFRGIGGRRRGAPFWARGEFQGIILGWGGPIWGPHLLKVGILFRSIVCCGNTRTVP